MGTKSLYRMIDIDGKGKGLVAERDLDAGTEILQDVAIIYVISCDYRTLVCHKCFLYSENLKKCSACKYVNYCGEKCQKRSWSDHKKECKLLKSVLPRTPPDFCMLVLRTLIKYFIDVGNDNIFNGMVSHLKRLNNSMRDKYETFFRVIMDLLGGELFARTSLSKGDVMELMAKLACNTFSVTNDKFEEIASGIFPLAYTLNHSCCPNTYPVFMGNTLTLRTLSAVKPNEELTINYVETLALPADRQKEILERYFFQCTCQRCANADEEAKEMLGGLCNSTVGCTGVLDTSSENGLCLKCNRQSEYKPECSPSVLMKKLSSLLSEKKVQYTLLQNAVHDCKDTLHPWNIKLIMAYEKLFDLCIKQELWNKAILWGDKALPGLQKYYSDVHPIVGSHICKLGKLHSLVGNLTEANRLLSQGIPLLSVSYGVTHKNVIELKEYYLHLKAEMEGALF